MTAPEILWWGRVAADVHFGIVLLGVMATEFLYLSGYPRTLSHTELRAGLSALWTGLWLGGYPLLLRPMLTAAMGG